MSLQRNCCAIYSHLIDILVLPPTVLRHGFRLKPWDPDANNYHQQNTRSFLYLIFHHACMSGFCSQSKRQIILAINRLVITLCLFLGHLTDNGKWQERSYASTCHIWFIVSIIELQYYQLVIPGLSPSEKRGFFFVFAVAYKENLRV